MDKKRASIFADEESDTLDITGFTRKTEGLTSPVTKEVAKEASRAANFFSREPSIQNIPSANKREQRRHRTGRNMQLNIKVTKEALGLFYEINDKEGWVLGETFENAIHALKDSLAVASKHKKKSE